MEPIERKKKIKSAGKRKMAKIKTIQENETGESGKEELKKKNGSKIK